MFRCSASCCEDNQASMQQVHRCIDRCHEPLAQAQALVTSELEKFQVRNIPNKSTLVIDAPLSQEMTSICSKFLALMS